MWSLKSAKNLEVICFTLCDADKERKPREGKATTLMGSSLDLAPGPPALSHSLLYRLQARA